MTIADITPRRAIEHLHERLGLTDAELSSALGVSARTLNRWRKAEAYPQHQARQTFDELLELSDLLEDIFESWNACRTWLRTENRYLGGLTPLDAIRVGRIDRARNALEAIESGVYL